MDYDALARDTLAPPSPDAGKVLPFGRPGAALPNAGTDFDDLASQVIAAPVSEAKKNLTLAAGTNPERTAQTMQVAKDLNLPQPAVDANFDVAKQSAQVQKNAAVVDQSPAVANFVAGNPLNAQIAHDDLPNLSAIDQAIQALGKGASYVFSAPDSKRGLLTDLYAGGKALLSGLPTAGAGLYGAASAPFELVGLDSVGGFLRNEQKAAEQQASRLQDLSPDAGVVERGVMSGLQSAGQNLALLPAGLANTARMTGEAMMLALMGITTGGQSYGKARDAGLSPAQAVPYAVEDATAEVVTEKYLGAAGFLKNIKAGASAAKLFAYELTKEVPGEMAATLWQNFNEWANVNPEKSVADWVNEQPEAQLETIIATLVGGSAQIGVVKSAEKLMHAGAERQQQAQQAITQGASLVQLNELATASKVRARDTDSFKAFIDQATQDGPVPDLYIDPNALAQSGVTVQELAALAPSLAPQLEAAAAGTDLRIPTDEFMTGIAGTPLAEQLLPHLKTEVGGMSQAEAEQYMATQGDQLQAEVERTLSEREVKDAHVTSRDAVEQHVFEQLQSTKRFADNVNQPYAALVAARYGVLAQQLDISPEEAFQRFPLNIQAQSVLGGKLDQPAYHGTAHEVDRFTTDKIGTGEGWQAYGHGMYFAKSKDIAEFYRKTVSEQHGAEGKLYKVEVPEDDELLDYDAKLKDQPPGVLAKLRKLRDVGNEVESAVVVDPNGKVIARRATLEQARRYIKDENINGKAQMRIADITGGQLYNKIAGRGIMARGTSARLLEAGIPGLRYLDADSRGDQATSKTHNFVIFDDEHVGEPERLNQGEKTANRGAFSPDTNTITLLKDADLSTFLHETGHFFLQMQAQFAAMQGAPAIVAADMDTLLDWFGVKATPEHSAIDVWHQMSLDEQREAHEQFARGFEAYLFSGNAPNVQLQGIFGRFRSWLINIYQSLKSLNVTLTPEVRRVMDRMLATQEEIEAKEAASSMGMLFKSQEEADQFGIDWAKYHGQGADATAKAIDELSSKSLKDMQWLDGAKSRELKKLQQAAAEKRKEMRREVRPQVLSQQVYQVWQFLTGKSEQVAAGEQAPDAIDTTAASAKLRLNVESMKDLSVEAKQRLRSLRMTSEENGMHPDNVAEMFGYSSGDEMIQAIVSSMTPREAVEAATDRAMLERYGDISSPEALDAAANEAIHNAVRQRMVATELAALERATDVRQGNAKTLPKAAKQFAEGLIARLKVRDIKPHQYEVAEARATRAAEKALKAGDIEQAATEKRNQLINGYATRAALDAQAEVDKARQYFRKFDSPAVRKAVDASYTDQIDLLLERYEFRAVPLKAVDKRKDLKSWVESQQAMGLEPEIPANLLEGVERKNYQDMTVEELRGLVDTVQSIEHLGRLKNRLLSAKDQKDYAAARDEIVAGIKAHADGRAADTRSPNTWLGQKKVGLKNFWAAHVKAATWARVLDGGKDGGPVWEYLIRSANDAGDHEVIAREKATKDLTELIQPVLKQGAMGGKGQFFPGINRSLNREARIAIALNLGNEGNMQRLLGGEGWTLQQLVPVTDTLTKADWDFVQSVWDYFETFRPEIGAKGRRLYGREPKWIELTQVVTKHGTYKGGYYPIKYDPRASSRAEEHANAEAAKQQLSGAYTSATTRRSFTKARAEEVNGRPLMYSLDGLYSGINEVIHDLSWHEWLIDANRLLKSDAISSAMRNTYGPEVHQQFKKWAEDIAIGDAATAAGEKALAWVRSGVSISGLGLNAMSALLQPFGITQSIVRVGPKYVGRGVAKFIASPIQLSKEIDGKSEFMRTRYLTRLRELAELRNRVQGETAARRVANSTAYWAMLRAQQMVDIPTWWGAYEKAIDEGNDESRAVALSDQAVIDSQGAGTTKDQAAIERGGAALKLFTVFYSFQNTALNLGVAQTMTSQSKAKLAADYLLLYVVPVILVKAMKDAITPGGGDDDDWGKWAKELAGDELSYLFGLMFMVREFTGAVQLATGTNKYPSDYQGPAGVRMVGDVAKLAKQTNQGEWDDGLRKAIVNVAGELLRLPAAQINRTITGIEALNDGDTSNPMALLLGYEKPHK